MARIWKEFSRRWPQSGMGLGWLPDASPYPPGPAEPASGGRIDPHPVYCVEVCGFTFRFESVAQIRAALAFYRNKVHPSSRISGVMEPGGFNEHDLVQRWYERVPQRLQREGKRHRVVAALER